MFWFTLFTIVVISVNYNDAASMDRIIGGRDAPDHQYPYQVSLRYNTAGVLSHFCGGSILNSRWILTAGHCIIDGSIYGDVVCVGTNYINERGDEYQIQNYIVHENFKNFYHNDIGLVQVKGEIRFSQYVQTIALADDNLNTNYVWAKFTGWGSTYYKGPYPNNLQEIDMEVIPNDQCTPFQHLITNMHICTFNRPQEGTCIADSGGPLVVNGYQVGVASYTTPCAVGDSDIYTRVSKYVNWIKSKIR